MKLCRTCRFGSEYELDKPCVVYREDCPLYEKEGEEMTNEEAIEELKAIKSEYSNKAFGDSRLMRSEIEALDVAIKALEQDNCPYYVIDKDGHGLCKNHRLEQEPCDDAISRQYLLDNCIVDKVTMPYVPVNKIKEALPINPQPKTGHWNEVFNDIEGEVRFYCSECNDYQMFTSRYCPNCGARMTENDRTCHTCKHYTSGEYDGSCGSYICKGYSDWESDNCN